MKPMWSSDSIALEAQIQTEDKRAKSVYKFNVSPEEGVVSLLKFLNLDATPANVAHALITVPDLVGERIGEYLSRPENNRALVEYFIQVGVKMDFLDAMRNVIRGPMKLPPEADDIDTIVGGFATAFLTENPGSFDSVDTCHVLAFALIMLNSDQHNPNVPKRMSSRQFIENVRGALNERAVSTKQLQKMFIAIRDEPFNYRKESPEKILALCEPRCSGYLKKKTNRWDSMWTSRFFVLANSCMYYFQDNLHSNNGSPLGMIQLVSVTVAPDEKDKKVTVITGTHGSIQFVRFKTGKPRLAKNVKRVYLEAPDEMAARKWRYRMMRSVVYGHGETCEELAAFQMSSGRSEPSD